MPVTTVFNIRIKQNNKYINMPERLYNWLPYKILKADRGRVQKRVFLLRFFLSHICDID